MIYNYSSFQEECDCKNCEIKSKERFNKCTVLQLLRHSTTCEQEFYEEMEYHDRMAEESRLEYEQDKAEEYFEEYDDNK